MDRRSLGELELLDVARWYALDTVVAPAPATPAQSRARSLVAKADWTATHLG